MTTPIASTDFDTVRDALADGSITLEIIAGRFIDLKTAYCDPLQLEVNDRNIDTFAKMGFDEEELEKAYEACRMGESPDGLLRWAACQSLEPKGADLYHKTGISSYKEFTIDCDGSKSAHIVPKAINRLYGLLWPNAKDFGADSADTMNSAWTTLDIVFKSLPCEEEIRNMLKGRRWNKENVSSALSETKNPVLENVSDEEDSSDRKIKHQAEALCFLTHTLGNFIPCPAPFNTGRYSTTSDYWDLTMLGIKEWCDICFFETRRKYPLNQGVLERCSAWLESYAKKASAANEEGWRQFVRENFLQPYVEDDYEVRLFFNGHSFDPEHKLPKSKDKEELLECLLSMNAGIIARGNLMLHAIVKKHESAPNELLPLVTPLSFDQLREEDGDSESS